MIVTASNVVYLILAAWLFHRRQYFEAGLLTLVGLTSIVFHLSPDNEQNKTIDIITANAAIILTFIIYFPKWRKRNKTIDANIVFAGATALLGLSLFLISDQDPESLNYVVLHSFWHIFTALAAYLFIRDSI